MSAAETCELALRKEREETARLREQLKWLSDALRELYLADREWRNSAVWQNAEYFKRVEKARNEACAAVYEATGIDPATEG